MGSRLQLQSLLEEITEHVYFQPPVNIQMQYPCIRYVRDDSKLEHAGNKLYKHTKRYQVTVIDRNPDSELPDQVIELPFCSFDRYFAAENLNHYVFTLFF
jgi:hypothetical protein